MAGNFSALAPHSARMSTTLRIATRFLLAKKRAMLMTLAGITFGTRHWQLSYAQALRTKEFKAQVKSSVFGSISTTFYY